jgi:hypothetical protein
VAEGDRSVGSLISTNQIRGIGIVSTHCPQDAILGKDSRDEPVPQGRLKITQDAILEYL